MITARSPSAFFISVLLHGLFIAVMTITAWVLKEEAAETVRIFELVAGEGDNYAATEAPALGTPEGSKVEVPPIPKVTPKLPEPSPVVTPPAPTPEPTPIKPAPPQPSPIQTVAPPKPEPKPVDFSKQIQKTADRKTKQVVAKFEKEQKAKEAAQKKAEEEAKKKLSKEDFDRIYGNKANPSQKAAQTKIAKIDAVGIAKGVIGGSTNNKTGGAGGKALTREEASQLELYISLLIQKLREAYESPPAANDSLVATVEFYLAANGTIARVRILKSSGDTEFDQSVLAAFRKLPSQGLGPKPDGRSETLALDFKVKDFQ